MLVERDGHLLWTGEVDSQGYGRFSITTKERVLVHRYMWEQEHGPLTPTDRIRWTCEHRTCVRHIEKSVPKRVRKRKGDEG